ncbi:tape measure protein [Glycomyces sp. NPDC047010]|uniref:tape measure protein n=1 Tax=Glycomyces sp. NPDC047010 TaxID=3155023 RepID=UPI0033D0A4DE
MATGGAKFATGFVELTLLDSSMLKRAQSLTAMVARDIEQNITRSLGASFDRIGDRLTSIGGEATIAFAPVTLAVGKIAADGWEMAKSVSSARNIFHQFGMEASDATAFVDELYGKSNAWGTSFNTMLEASIKLWPAFGGNVDEIRYAMEGLYNVTGKYHLSAEAVNGVMRAFVQISQKGKVQAEEMLQVSEWGVDSWGLFSRALGISTQELRDMTAAGEALAEDVMPKVYKYLNENPEFAGKASAGIETMSGQLMILQNQLGFLVGGALADKNTELVAAFKNLNVALGTLIDSGFVAEFLTPVINGFAVFAEWLAGMDGGTLALIAGLTLLAAVIGPLLLIAGRLFAHLGEGTEAVGRFNGRVTETAKTITGGFKRSLLYFVNAWRTTPVPIRATVIAMQLVSGTVGRLASVLIYPIDNLKILYNQAYRLQAGLGRLAYQGLGTAINFLHRVPGAVTGAARSIRDLAVTAGQRTAAAFRTTVAAVRDWRGTLEAAALSAARGAGVAYRALRQGLTDTAQAARNAAVALGTGFVRGLRATQNALFNGVLRASNATVLGLSKLGTVAARVARDGIAALGRNAGNIARGGLNALRGGLMGAALAAGALLVSGVAIGPAVADAGAQVITAIQNLPVLAEALATQLPGIITEAVATLALVLPELVASLSEGGPLILQAVTDSLGVLGQAAVQAAPTLLALAVSLIGQLASYLATNAPVLVDGFMTIFPDIVAGIGTAAGALVGAIGLLVPPLLQAIVSAIPVLVSGFISLFPILVTSILEALPGLVSAFLLAVPQLILGIVEAIPSIVESVVSMVPEIISTLVPMLPQIVVALLLLIPQLIIAILGAIPDIVTSVVKMIPEIATALVEALPEAVDAFMELWPQIQDAWSGAYGEFKQLGRDLIEAIKDGLSAAWDSVSSWVSDKVSSIDLNPFSTSDSATVSIAADTSAVTRAFAPLAATFSAADLPIDSVQTFDAGSFASAVDSLGAIEIDARSGAPQVAVRVYLGETELTDLVRTEIRVLDEKDRAFAAAGAR